MAWIKSGDAKAESSECDNEQRILIYMMVRSMRTKNQRIIASIGKRMEEYA